MPHDVIMPALGMAQETGVVLRWHKAQGDPVAAGDVLLEVETDKATMEVEAGRDGFIADLRAAEGDTVPVGEIIAIVSDTPPDPAAAPTTTAPPAADTAPAPSAPAPEAPKPEAPAAATAPAPSAPPAPRPDGRILASPKAKRLAREEGLNLARLVTLGVPEPFHVADLERLRTLPAPAPAQALAAPAGAVNELTASVAATDFAAFREWVMAESKGAVTPAGLWAAFAAGSLRAAFIGTATSTMTVQVETPGNGEAAVRFVDPDLARLSRVAGTGVDNGHAAPDLVVRDMTATRISALRLGADSAPSLTIARGDDATSLTLTLRFEATSLDVNTAVPVLEGIAARIETPLRHLL